MPYLRRTRFNRKRKSTRRNAQLVPRRRYRSKVPRALPFALPNTYRARHKWTQELNLNPGIGQILGLVFKTNDIITPYSASSHQPYGTDTLKLVYDRCLVTRATIRAQVINTASGNTIPPMYLTCNISDDGTDYATMGSMTNFLESKHASPIKVAGYVYQASSSAPCSVTATWNGVKSFGKGYNRADSEYLNDCSPGAEVGPDIQRFFEIIGASPMGSDSAQQNILVNIWYDCLWSNPRNLQDS